MVLNKTNDKISDKTKEKVFLAAKDLGYNPNKYAKALASKKSNIIMAIIPDIANPFFSMLVKYLTNYSLKHDYFLYIHNTNNKKIKKGEFENLLKSNYAAACLVVDRNINKISQKARNR